jgi:Flp pilus assembly protein TadG
MSIVCVMSNSLYSQVSGLLSRFRRARRGNVAITFALAIVPIIGLTGAAIDYSRANAVSAAMQTALDSTALMLSKEATADTSGQLQQNALKYFTALFGEPETKNVTVTASYASNSGSQIVVTGSAEVPTTFLGIIGYQNITVDGSSTAKWGSSRLRVALVLDNTGSMADDGKITALKTATKNLLAQLKSAAGTDGDVYVSIVPFSKDVSVDPNSNYAGNWIDWSDWDNANGNSQTSTTCSNSGGSRHGRSTCTTTQTWVPDNHNTWNGCITDRDQNYDQTVTPANPADDSLPASATSTLYPAEQYSSCPLHMMGLSYDWNNMNSLVGQMYPNGNTNQPIGLVWGWLSLVGGGPLSAPPLDSNYQYQQIIILLSDGLNTQDRWYSAQTQVDNRMYQTGKGSGTCANIKAAGITIYSIQVNTGGDPKSTLLQNCASSSDKFWMLTSASQILTTFNTIGTNLTKLRVAK